MELVAWSMHKYLMHGPLWVWHKSHHTDHEDMLELNDLFGLFFALPSIALFWFGTSPDIVWAWWTGLGMTFYGLVYFLFHDVLVHRRFAWFPVPKRGYLKRVYQAHRLHHAVKTKDGAVSFGFVIAFSAKHLQAKLRERSQNG